MDPRTAPGLVYLHDHSRTSIWRLRKEALRLARAQVEPLQPSDGEQRIRDPGGFLRVEHFCLSLIDCGDKEIEEEIEHGSASTGCAADSCLNCSAQHTRKLGLSYSGSMLFYLPTEKPWSELKTLIGTLKFSYTWELNFFCKQTWFLGYVYIPSCIKWPCKSSYQWRQLNA